MCGSKDVRLRGVFCSPWASILDLEELELLLGVTIGPPCDSKRITAQVLIISSMRSEPVAKLSCSQKDPVIVAAQFPRTRLFGTAETRWWCLATALTGTWHVLMSFLNFRLRKASDQQALPWNDAELQGISNCSKLDLTVTTDNIGSLRAAMKVGKAALKDPDEVEIPDEIPEANDVDSIAARDRGVLSSGVSTRSGRSGRSVAPSTRSTRSTRSSSRAATPTPSLDEQLRQTSLSELSTPQKKKRHPSKAPSRHNEKTPRDGRRTIQTVKMYFLTVLLNNNSLHCAFSEQTADLECAHLIAARFQGLDVHRRLEQAFGGQILLSSKLNLSLRTSFYPPSGVFKIIILSVHGPLHSFIDEKGLALFYFTALNESDPITPLHLFFDHLDMLDDHPVGPDTSSIDWLHELRRAHPLLVSLHYCPSNPEFSLSQFRATAIAMLLPSRLCIRPRIKKRKSLLLVPSPRGYAHDYMQTKPYQGRPLAKEGNVTLSHGKMLPSSAHRITICHQQSPLHSRCMSSQTASSIWKMPLASISRNYVSRNQGHLQRVRRAGDDGSVGFWRRTSSPTSVTITLTIFDPRNLHSHITPRNAGRRSLVLLSSWLASAGEWGTRRLYGLTGQSKPQLSSSPMTRANLPWVVVVSGSMGLDRRGAVNQAVTLDLRKEKVIGSRRMAMEGVEVGGILGKGKLARGQHTRRHPPPMPKTSLLSGKLQTRRNASPSSFLDIFFTSSPLAWTDFRNCVHGARATFTLGEAAKQTTWRRQGLGSSSGPSKLGVDVFLEMPQTFSYILFNFRNNIISFL